MLFCCVIFILELGIIVTAILKVATSNLATCMARWLSDVKQFSPQSLQVKPRSKGLSS